jgi:hypothetical protein
MHVEVAPGGGESQEAGWSKPQRPLLTGGRRGGGFVGSRSLLLFVGRAPSARLFQTIEFRRADRAPLIAGVPDPRRAAMTAVPNIESVIVRRVARTLEPLDPIEQHNLAGKGQLVPKEVDPGLAAVEINLKQQEQPFGLEPESVPDEFSRQLAADAVGRVGGDGLDASGMAARQKKPSRVTITSTPSTASAEARQPAPVAGSQTTETPSPLSQSAKMAATYGGVL